LGRASASAIPAVSALRALRRFGALLGERVLVIGASGAVGWFAIQLGRLAGAEITACVRSLERGAGLRELGATDVVTDLAHVKGRFRGVIDNVGGSQLVQAFQLLNEGGSVQTLGSMSAEPAVFPPYSTLGPRRAIESFWAGSQMSADLGYVLGLAAAGRLELTDGPCHDWTYFERVATQLAESPRAARAIMSVHRN
ncbi:MAG TPA: zinc-binding dehydrogenase, partial [Anaeromyxobacter sp.]